MTDHELMTLAAKAVGYEVHGDKHPPDGLNVRMNGKLRTWSPLVSDGDAFRLMVELGINPFQGCYVWIEGCECYVDRHEVTDMRRAIVRAAAAMGGEL